MELHWLAVLGCLCFLANPGQSGPVTTQNTLVVAGSEEVTTEEATTPEILTEGPLPPVKLLKLEVVSVVSLRYAHTKVVARVKNPAKRSQEAHFRVLLPETAFISGFAMTLHRTCYKAFVKEKGEAQKIYNHAVNRGIGAGYITAKARDSNQFVVSVNVEPLSSATFNLTYEEMLVRRKNVYNHAINLHPGALVPNLTVTVHIKEAQKITELRVPEIRTGNEIDATKDDAQNKIAVIRRRNHGREATITFSPDLKEQNRLMQIYSMKSNEPASSMYRFLTSATNINNQHIGVLGQFVVQYDVERPQDGEILVNDGYFVHFFAPPNLPPLNKYVVFVLDTSSSMMGRKIIQLREAMQIILSDLNPGDFFSIVEFGSSVTIHDMNEADQTNNIDKQDRLIAPFPANPENINKAKIIISRFVADEATNAYDALDAALNLINNRVNWGNKLNTNGSAEAVTGVATADGGNDLYNIEKMKTLEPIIIFLTDGQPTEGVTDTTTIVNHVSTKNSGNPKAVIFSLAFGQDADREFLRKLSLLNDGFMRHIYEAADAALQLRDFYRQVSSPLLADVKFVYPVDQVKEGTLTKNHFRSYYAGSEIVLSGQLADSVTELTPQVQASGGFGTACYNKQLKVTVPAKDSSLPLERFWTYLTIKQLLDEKDATIGDSDLNKENSPANRAMALALKYQFVTPLSSLVVVKPDATNEIVEAVSVDDPVPSFYGSSYYYSMSSSMPMKTQHFPSITPAVTTTENPIAKYALQEFSWMEPLVNTSTDVLSMDVNGTRLDLKLAKGSVLPKMLGGDEACARSMDGGEGLCVYLTRCESAKYISLDIYKTTFCTVYDGYGYAGVCCNDVLTD